MSLSQGRQICVCKARFVDHRGGGGAPVPEVEPRGDAVVVGHGRGAACPLAGKGVTVPVQKAEISIHRPNQAWSGPDERAAVRKIRMGDVVRL